MIMKTKTHILIALLFAGVAGSFAAHAGDVVVVVNKANANAVDKDFIVKVYSGEVKTWPDGGTVQLIDQSESSPARVDFDTNILAKPVSKMKAIWAQLIFTGKALPPKVIDGDDAVIKAVGSNKDAIGYLAPGKADASVKVVLK